MNRIKILGCLAGCVSVVASAAGIDATSPIKPPLRPDLLWGGIERIVPLYDESTPREPDLYETTPGHVITRFGGRVRDRHARESQYQAYQHFPPNYFEKRTFGIEIDDTTPGGGSQITFTLNTVHPHNGTNFRSFFRGITTVAEYHHNATFAQVGPNRYETTITYNNALGRPIQSGDLIEIEAGIFLAPPVTGRTNYYSRAFLYRAGSAGIVPWQAEGPLNNSQPLPEAGRSGGATTLSYNYSAEPEDYLIQMALNISGANAQQFVEGRRLHHTNFDDGSHSEPGNPNLPGAAGKLGPLYNARSCIACHERNGRNGNLARHIVKLDRDPAWGSQLQPIAQAPAQPEPQISVTGLSTIDGQFADGMDYQLSRPVHAFSGVVTGSYSVRMPNALVGMGLLEAIDETTIKRLADPDDNDGDGISGRVNRVADPITGVARLGRFGWKAGTVSVRHQVARALAMDMGVTSSVVRSPDCGSMQAGCDTTPAPPEFDDAALDKLVRYIALLGVPPQRDLNDPSVIAGRQLFETAGCAGCHAATLATGPYHPFAELRNQTIHPYTDLLLHNMGPDLADDIRESTADGNEWRTAPLWGLGLGAVTATQDGYLHDGRAATILEAVLWHGGEAESSKQAVIEMSATERAALVDFLESL